MRGSAKLSVIAAFRKRLDILCVDTGRVKGFPRIDGGVEVMLTMVPASRAVYHCFTLVVVSATRSLMVRLSSDHLLSGSVRLFIVSSSDKILERIKNNGLGL